MKSIKRGMGCLLIIALLLLLMGCGETPKNSITIGLLQDVNSLPMLVADEEKLYEEEGVEVRLEMFKSAIDRDAALQSGNIDGASSDLLSAALLNEAGIDVAATSYTDGRYVLLAAGNSQITKPEGLKGKDIAISSNTIIEYMTNVMLVKNGLAEDEIKMVAIPQMPTRMEMLASGKVAAACLPDPLATLARTRGAVEITDNIKEGFGPGIMLFRGSVIREKQEGIRAFFRAYNKAVDLLNEKGDQYRSILVEKAGFPEETKDVLEFPRYQKARIPDPKDVASVLEWMKKKDMLKKDLTYDDLIWKGLTE
ncbi:MAG: ABC transporter substrate-binding protein [Clostridia bacterium]|jgi:NitT/TauT family transport system substrate-binding protein